MPTPELEDLRILNVWAFYKLFREWEVQPSLQMWFLDVYSKRGTKPRTGAAWNAFYSTYTSLSISECYRAFFNAKKFEVPIVAYLRGLHECRAILSNSCASTHPAPVVLCPPNNFCPTRLLLREKMSHPIFAQHLRLEVERCFNESKNR